MSWITDVMLSVMSEDRDNANAFSFWLTMKPSE